MRIPRKFFVVLAFSVGAISFMPNMARATVFSGACGGGSNVHDFIVGAQHHGVADDVIATTGSHVGLDGNDVQLLAKHNIVAVYTTRGVWVENFTCEDGHYVDLHAQKYLPPGTKLYMAQKSAPKPGQSKTVHEAFDESCGNRNTGNIPVRRPGHKHRHHRHHRHHHRHHHKPKPVQPSPQPPTQNCSGNNGSGSVGSVTGNCSSQGSCNGVANCNIVVPPPVVEQPPITHFTQVSCTGFEEISGGSSLVVDCDVSNDNGAPITLDVGYDTSVLQVSGMRCISQNDAASCLGNGTYEFRVKGINDGTSVIHATMTMVATSNNVASKSFVASFDVDPSCGGFGC